MANRATLEALIEEATMDAYSDDEQLGGFYNLIEDRLELPFKTEVLGVQVDVVAVDQDDRGNIFAVCEREGTRQALPILELPLPKRRPMGAEAIEAYRVWAEGD